LLAIYANELLSDSFQSDCTGADGIVGLFLIKLTWVLSVWSQSAWICPATLPSCPAGPWACTPVSVFPINQLPVVLSICGVTPSLPLLPF
jgi:hypothetical protein